ncbi:MAG: hypothetical protein PVH19_08290 [Planctomycetia bacterium]|jgi:hypothetical protein
MKKILILLFFLSPVCLMGAEPEADNPPAPKTEPEAINPFGPKPAVREDARQGTILTSDGKRHVGMIYLTRDMRLKIYDEKAKRQRELPLRVVERIDATVKWERMEKEWQFQELAADKKLYTGKEYPAREYVHTITLKDGRKITGPISAIVYLKAPAEEDKPEKETRYLLHKRQKGKPETTLKKLIYVQSIDFGGTGSKPVDPKPVDQESADQKPLDQKPDK